MLSQVTNICNMSSGNPIVQRASRMSREILEGMDRLEAMIEKETNPQRKEELETLLQKAEFAAKTLRNQINHEMMKEIK